MGSEEALLLESILIGTFIGYLVLWIILGIVVAMIADHKGYEWFPWFLYGFAIFPIALTHILLREKRPKHQSPDENTSSSHTTETQITAEMIRKLRKEK